MSKLTVGVPFAWMHLCYRSCSEDSECIDHLRVTQKNRGTCFFHSCFYLSYPFKDDSRGQAETFEGKTEFLGHRSPHNYACIILGLPSYPLDI